MEITLSILIGTKNRLPALTRTLNALMGRVKSSHEIIVIDAGSTDGTLEYLRQVKGITLVDEGQQLGQAKSLNNVIRNLDSRYVCWLSDDNMVMEGMLDKAVRILDGNSKIGMVSLKVRDVAGHFSDEPYIGGFWSGILNCNQGMLSTRLVKELGGFDETLQDYGIDIDLTTCVLLAGYQVVLTKKVAVHHYRDYETNTWIDSDSRKIRLQKAKDLYSKKFQKFLKNKKSRSYLKGEKSPILPLILYLYRTTARRGILLEKVFGVNTRDWYNVLSGDYISIGDFIFCVGKPYYLVQKIPARDLRGIVEEKVA